SIFLTLLVVDKLVAWNNDGEYAANTITVQGTGEIVAVPDVATFTYSVDITSESVESAQEEAAKKTNIVLEFLKESGIEEGDIKTVSYNASPRYEYIPCRGFDCGASERKLIGYSVNQTTLVKVRDTEKAGGILSGVGARGITNISGLNFSIDDPEALKESARSMAIEEARDKAEKLASDLGVKIKRVVNFYEEGGRGGPIMMEASFDSAVSAKAVPELPVGENEVSVTVSVTYEIK
ncbi:MAG: hypothetical protein ACI9GH_000481, partial [Candidatus Paceibacteria bacterium]